VWTHVALTIKIHRELKKMQIVKKEKKYTVKVYPENKIVSHQMHGFVEGSEKGVTVEVFKSYDDGMEWLKKQG